MVDLITRYGLEIISLYRNNYLASFHIREMAKLIRKSHVTLLPHLKKLEKNNILMFKISGKNKVYSLNMDNLESKELISIAEKKVSLESINKNIFIKKILETATKLNLRGCLVLFGSFASDTSNKESDIDLLYIGKITDTERKKVAALGGLYNKKIHLTTINYQEFKTALKKNVTLIKEVINNHIILLNHDIFINQLWGYYNEKRT